RCGNPLIERAMANLMEGGIIRRSLRKAVKSYRSRRDLLCSLLDGIPQYLHFVKPEGGMAVWVEFSKTIDLHQLICDCGESSLFLTSPEDYNTEKSNFLRLGYAMMNEKEIELAFGILKTSLQQQDHSD
ncbi:MAG: aminotransferase class I/II-fold pyridoxal phosphate-dependent enzyme, partial [Cyclobacteriaceae bacterium]